MSSPGHNSRPESGESRRPRIALVEGSATDGTASLQATLRRRLIVATGVSGGSLGLTQIVALLRSSPARAASHTDLASWLLAHHPRVVQLVSSVVLLSLALGLARLPGLSLRRMRQVEVITFGLLMAFCASDTLAISTGFIPHAVPRFNLLANASILPWFSVMLVYGVLIPNRAQRCLRVVGVMAALGTACMVGSWVLRGAAAPQLAGWVANLVVWFVVAISLTVSGAHWLESLRLQALDARRLGQYRLLRLLGQGGMGEVHLAEHVLLRRPCAVKLIRAVHAVDARQLLRFEREVKATAALNHPNTIQVYDYGRAEDGSFYYAMEYLPGLTLDQLVAEAGPLSPGRAVHLLRQVCGALQEAHGAGLVHRDIKPGNVMVCSRGGAHDVAKLLDFGLVMPLDGREDGEKLTQDGGIAGTPAFLSPEQARGGQDLDARSDIYSVGALAYYLLSGRSPFSGRPPMAMVAAHLYEPPEPVSRAVPGTPEALESVVMRCLAKAPADRFPTAAALEAALAGCPTPAWGEAEAAAWWSARGQAA